MSQKFHGNFGFQLGFPPSYETLMFECVHRDVFISILTVTLPVDKRKHILKTFLKILSALVRHYHDDHRANRCMR